MRRARLPFAALLVTFAWAPSAGAQVSPRQPVRGELPVAGASGPGKVAATATTDGVMITWAGVPQATQYVIARAPAGGGTPSPIGRAPAGSTSYVDRGQNSAATYTVVAVLSNGSQLSSAAVAFTPATSAVSKGVPLEDPRLRPTITSVQPATVPAGLSNFLVNGTNLQTVTSVKVDGQARQFAAASTACNPSIPAGSWLSVDAANLSAGAHTVLLASQYSQVTGSFTVAKSRITVVTPDIAKPGDFVTISGEHLGDALNFSGVGPCNALASTTIQRPTVTFNGFASPVVETDGAMIRAQVPARPGGTLRVGTQWYGTAEWPGFREMPVPSAIPPATFSAGSTVTLTGSSMDLIDSVALANVVLQPRSKSYTSLSFVIPPSMNITGDLSVTLYAKVPGLIVSWGNARNTISLQAKASLASVAPDSGSPGDQISFRGSMLGVPPAGASASWKPGISFNGVPSPMVIVNTQDMLTAIVPNDATSGPVVVQSSSGPLSGPASFRVNRAPKLVSVYPPSGQRVGQPVQIIIRSGSPPTAVAFGAVTVTSGWTLKTDYGRFELNLAVPQGATTGALTVTTRDGVTAWTAAPWVISP